MLPAEYRSSFGTQFWNTVLEHSFGTTENLFAYVLRNVGQQFIPESFEPKL